MWIHRSNYSGRPQWSDYAVGRLFDRTHGQPQLHRPESRFAVLCDGGTFRMGTSFAHTFYFVGRWMWGGGGEGMRMHPFYAVTLLSLLTLSSPHAQICCVFGVAILNHVIRWLCRRPTTGRQRCMSSPCKITLLSTTLICTSVRSFTTASSDIICT